MLKDEFTLEKMKIHDRLGKVEIQIELLSENSKNHSKKMDDHKIDVLMGIKDIRNDVKDISKNFNNVIYGNGNNGIKTHLSNLMNDVKNHRWIIIFLLTSIVGIAVYIIRMSLIS